MQVINNESSTQLKPKDFTTAQEVKWCPGCGDYSILKQVQTVFPDLGIPKEKFVFISGIGCSARFTYYMDCYGMHSIHGRAAAIASGVKMANPELSVWVVSGDGDSLSIGGNHFIHTLRKNFNINYLLFNNQIYSLTKGQYSPSSEHGKRTKTSPYGTIEEPVNTIGLALGASASFVARTLDRNPKHIQTMLKRAHDFQGTSFIEIYQNCPIFNDGAFFSYSDKELKMQEALFLEQGQPLVFGPNNELGIQLDGLTPRIRQLNKNGISLEDLWIHDEQDKTKANLLARFFDEAFDGQYFPRPFGVIYARERPVYEGQMALQIQEAVDQDGRVSLDTILSGNQYWQIL